MSPTERTLILLRHAKSSWDSPRGDHERPLASRGRRAAAQVGRLLVERNVRPDLVVVSSATRTRETWALVADQGVDAAAVSISDDLYDADHPDIVDLVRTLPADATAVVLVGHFPGIPDAVEVLADGRGDDDAWERMRWKYPTAGMATLRYAGEWADIASGDAELVAFDTPDD